MYRVADCSLDDFRALVERRVDRDDFPRAADVVAGVLQYDAATLRRALHSDEHGVLDELARSFSTGPGVVRIVGALEHDVIERVSAQFDEMIESQHRDGATAGDHYAKPGDNDRVWNALEKLAVADPAAFIDYYSSDMLAAGSLAWLGPGYQVTSQVNVVNPGGAAQQPHRDYHLGFLTDDVAEQYPPHVHGLSPLLTLQGLIAHVDMPAETGPTLVLPHSHKYELGYLAWRRREFIDYFEEHRVQPELGKGDLVWLNPAVFHAAGCNRTTDVRRMANLLQVSSALGRAMESVDRYRMVRALYPELRRRWTAPAERPGLRRALAASAEGYAFPSNVDRDQPVGRLTPESAYEVTLECLESGADDAVVHARLAAHADKRLTH